MQLAFVYVLVFHRTKLFYVGSSYDLEKRIDRHIRELEKGIHHNSILQRQYSANDSYSYSSIEMPDRKKAYILEEELMTLFRKGIGGYICANIGVSSVGGDNLSLNPNRQSIISKITNSVNNNISSLTSVERKNKWGKSGALNGMYGKTHSENTRKILSKANLGHSRNKGIKLSLQHIEKIRARAKLLVGNKNPFYGKKHSKETIEKLRLANTGKTYVDTKKVVANGIEYISVKEAAKANNISTTLAYHRVKNKKYNNWFYLSETSDN